MKSFAVCRANSHRTLDESRSATVDPNHSKHVHRTGAPRRPGAGSGSASVCEGSESSPGDTAEWSGSSEVTRGIVECC